jgi:hypothetical protein
MSQTTRVCDDCLQSAADESLAPAEECDLLCLELGSEIADHLCEEIELDGAVRCDCACHQSVKRKLRVAAPVSGGSV